MPGLAADDNPVNSRKVKPGDLTEQWLQRQKPDGRVDRTNCIDSASSRRNPQTSERGREAPAPDSVESTFDAHVLGVVVSDILVWVHRFRSSRLGLSVSPK